MSQLVECVPNFSEGNNKEVIDAISGAITQTAGCVLLDVDSGPSTNRTVYTFVGRPECVVKGALNAAHTAWRLIDMTKHHGEHPRMGALDVCPFIPVRGVSMEDCVRCAQAFGQQLAEELSVPATKEQAHRIALNLREQGRGKEQPGRLKKVQGIGWYLEEKNLAQVSMNLLDFEVMGLHTVFEETCREAQELSLPVVGSQLVGLVPLQALLDAAAFYCHRENLFVLEEEHRIRLVVSRLGLDSLAPFNPKERVIEYLVSDGPAQSLLDLSLRDFFREVGARSAAPGGGSVAAAAGAMGAALACMAGQMTYGRRRFEHLDAAMRQLIPPFHKAVAQLASLVDADAQAFAACLEVMKLPRNTPEEGDRRAAALQERLKQAVEVPLALAERVSLLWPVLQELACFGNLACRSDLQVAAKALETSVFGAYFNVLTNLQDMADEAFRDQTRQRISSLLQEAKTQAAQVLDNLEARQA
ncbi:PREDICTED: formimidoyltransferase-cyclodeaminase isoform X2 [Chinchilla lanigera]|uniref:formimidoyltransferase-cyclodeaminase isoform X2 n=1 Tax=Chinchilla lanigera TaxID=34839 RepID=UPI000695AFE4|nr:PREDICTED: formimidoyltransferase-cyclodeaminase isoform X2 [Chinchilla lanigera]